MSSTRYTFKTDGYTGRVTSSKLEYGGTCWTIYINGALAAQTMGSVNDMKWTTRDVLKTRRMIKGEQPKNGKWPTVTFTKAR